MHLICDRSCVHLHSLQDIVQGERDERTRRMFPTQPQQLGKQTIQQSKLWAMYLHVKGIFVTFFPHLAQKFASDVIVPVVSDVAEAMLVAVKSALVRSKDLQKDIRAAQSFPVRHAQHSRESSIPWSSLCQHGTRVDFG